MVGYINKSTAEMETSQQKHFTTQNISQINILIWCDAGTKHFSQLIQHIYEFCLHSYYAREQLHFILIIISTSNLHFC